MNAGKHVLRAMVVADDTVRRQQLLQALTRQADIAVVAQATSAVEVGGLAERTSAEVVVLDLHLLDGSAQAAIAEIMSSSPRPILVLAGASATGESADALSAGAVETVFLPAAWTLESGAVLRRAVHQVSKVHVIHRPRGAQRRAAAPRSSAGTREPALTGAAPRGCPVVAVAASTGGPSALAVLLAGLGGLPAPVLVVQHLHADFGNGLLEWMSRESALPVSVAVDGVLARRGHVYLGPAGLHLRMGAHGRIELSAVPAGLHCPSADELFQSLADRCGRAGVGVVLTGMGDDGARGLLSLHERGGQTLAQDRATCAVFGMPQAAQRIGAVTEMRPLAQLAAAVHRAVAGVLA